ncbi:MAG TPA: hypothetical protein PKD09_14530 [Aggregatilinea sp.]|uniref:hypothetical protein n=1 Tax=Aggregatilinea sp. TaxID=2806333 RepID=UPI002C93A91B|nr:hypothetical protein [Aggregatilinea sp.]HML22864.1 hypothetical protein [Aggregatilinea sp.]
MSIPALAGVCTYAEAAQPGYTVEENVKRLVRYAWIQKRAMETGLYWLNPTPEWEVKEALSLHLYQDAEHAKLIRARVSEMRNPPPRMDVSPDPALDRFFDELLASQDTLEKVAGLYGVLRPALLDAYRAHYDGSNPLVDFPTRRIVRFMIVEAEDAVQWGEQALAALTESDAERERVETWMAHLRAYLDAAGGVAGDVQAPEQLPAPRATGDFVPDFFPQRDDRFTGRWNFVFPPHEVARTEGVPVEEKTLALMCKRTLEMDVPEAMARMIAEAEGMPWEYYVDMARQLWDEARHAMMGSVYFEALGVDWKHEIPLHPGFALRLNQHMDALDAHAVLYTIEQSLMPAKTGKRYEWETAVDAHDPLATLFQDYDWADEVLHAQVGRRWLLDAHKLSREAVVKLGQQRATESEADLAQYADRGAQVNWWPDFVRRVLGRESAMQDYALGTADPVYRAAE